MLQHRSWNLIPGIWSVATWYLKCCHLGAGMLSPGSGCVVTWELSCCYLLGDISYLEADLLKVKSFAQA